MNGVPLSDILARGRNNFDLVRLIAAASVIVSHAFALVSGSAETEPLASVSIYTLGQHAVNVFFVVSGLLVASSLDRSQDIVEFAAARALRVFPGLILCVLLTAYVLGPAVSSLGALDYLASPVTHAYVAITLSLSTALAPLPGVFETLPAAGEVNIPIWSLKYEILAYVVLALLAVTGIWRRRRLFWLFLSVLFITHMAGEAAHAGVDDHATIDQASRFLVCFFLGVAAYRLRKVLRLSLPGAIAAVLLLLASWGTEVEETIIYVAVGYLTLCVAALPTGFLRQLCARRDISYGLYIYGWPVAQTILLAFPEIGPIGLAMASLSITAMIAALSWQLVEQPALGLRTELASLAGSRAG